MNSYCSRSPSFSITYAITRIFWESNGQGRQIHACQTQLHVTSTNQISRSSINAFPEILYGQPCAGSFVQTVRKLHLADLRSDTNRGHMLTILVGIAIEKSHLSRFKMVGTPSKSPASHLEAVHRRATSYTSCSARPARSAPSFLVGCVPQSWATGTRICRYPPGSRSPPD